MLNKSFWKNKNVLITGHTGFKGAWLSLVLQNLNANILGVSLMPPTSPNLFEISNVEHGMTSKIEDIRNAAKIKKIFNEFKPEIVFHLAAQSLVLRSYEDPLETLSTNIIGTANLLESTRDSSVKAFINVTSDKCYENNNTENPFKEVDRMGGDDLYSCSKGCSELITNAYRKSFFDASNCNIASVRAGNVLGGGDWAENRLIPDLLRSIESKSTFVIRNPNSTRPWQHVLEPLSGYIMLAQKLFASDKREWNEGWNFGPDLEGTVPVIELIRKFKEISGLNFDIKINSGKFGAEAKTLQLDNSKAKERLQWIPKWSLTNTLENIWEWQFNYLEKKDMKEITNNQIINYFDLA